MDSSLKSVLGNGASNQERVHLNALHSGDRLRWNQTKGLMATQAGPRIVLVLKASFILHRL